MSVFAFLTYRYALYYQLGGRTLEAFEKDKKTPTRANTHTYGEAVEELDDTKERPQLIMADRTWGILIMKYVKRRRG